MFNPAPRGHFLASLTARAQTPFTCYALTGGLSRQVRQRVGSPFLPTLRAQTPFACYALTGGPQWPSSPTGWLALFIPLIYYSVLKPQDIFNATRIILGYFPLGAGGERLGLRSLTRLTWRLRRKMGWRNLKWQTARRWRYSLAPSRYFV